MNKFLSPEWVTVLVVYGCLATTVVTEGKLNLNEVMSFSAGGYYGYLRGINQK